MESPRVTYTESHPVTYTERPRVTYTGSPRVMYTVSPRFTYTGSARATCTGTPRVIYTESPRVTYTGSHPVTYTESPRVTYTGSPRVRYTVSPRFTYTGSPRRKYTRSTHNTYTECPRVRRQEVLKLVTQLPNPIIQTRPPTVDPMEKTLPRSHRTAQLPSHNLAQGIAKPWTANKIYSIHPSIQLALNTAVGNHTSPIISPVASLILRSPTSGTCVWDVTGSHVLFPPFFAFNISHSLRSEWQVWGAILFQRLSEVGSGV